MDLFGEQTVQVVTAVLQAAIVLLAAALIMVLSARVPQSAALRPAIGMLACTGRPLCPERDDDTSFDGLHSCLLTRAPPDHPRSDIASTAGWRLFMDRSRLRRTLRPRATRRFRVRQ